MHGKAFGVAVFAIAREEPICARNKVLKELNLQGF
jgi:hypothetical protein